MKECKKATVERLTSMISVARGRLEQLQEDLSQAQEDLSHWQEQLRDAVLPPRTYGQKKAQVLRENCYVEVGMDKYAADLDIAFSDGFAAGAMKQMEADSKLAMASLPVVKENE
jgi:hypothetical protein